MDSSATSNKISIFHEFYLDSIHPPWTRSIMPAGYRRALEMDVRAIRDDRTLRRIAVTLVALAVLAERVASRSYPVRCLVLFILRQAESVAKAFVVEATQTPRLAFVQTPAFPNSPAAAIGLASRFRALAAVLAALLWLACPFARWNSCIDRAARSYGLRSGRLPITPDDWTQRPNDTS